MSGRKPLSRRAFLRGPAGAVVALPFLEAMLPSLANAATRVPRFVSVYGGAPTYFARSPKTMPSGSLTSVLPSAISALDPVRQHVSVLLSMAYPSYVDGTTPPPGGVVSRQHYNVPAPGLGGVASLERKPMMSGAHTVDQVFADAFGSTSQFKSIQARVQAAGYGYGVNGGIVSSRFVNGVLNTLDPVVSPLALYQKLFSQLTPPASGVGAVPSVSAQVLNRRSVLDLVLSDANRLISQLSGEDRIRMDQHFTEIREIEKRLAPTGSVTPVVAGGSCVKPAVPGADPAIANESALGGWGNETLRGDLQADILALALACDLTRSVSWQLTFDQCGLGSFDISKVNNDFHQISHDVGNNASLNDAMEKHTNWHCARFARLVDRLSKLQEGSGTVLDNTFLGMIFGEGTSAHNRSNMHCFVAGNASAVKLGQYINTAGEHPARMWIAGLNSLGLNTNRLGEVTGVMQSLLK